MRFSRSEATLSHNNSQFVSVRIPTAQSQDLHGDQKIKMVITSVCSGPRVRVLGRRFGQVKNNYGMFHLPGRRNGDKCLPHQHRCQATHIRRREQTIQQKSSTNLSPHRTDRFRSEQRAAGTSGTCCHDTDPQINWPSIFRPGGLVFRRRPRGRTSQPGNKRDGPMKSRETFRPSLSAGTARNSGIKQPLKMQPPHP